MELYTCRTETIARKVMFVDNNRETYRNNFTFSGENLNGEKENMLDKINSM